MTENAQEARRPRLLTVAQLSAEVGISEVTLYRLIRAGEFPAVRMGRRVFVPASVIDQLGEAALASGGTVTAAELFGGAS